MRILLDHCMPHGLRRHLPAHAVVTAAYTDCDELRNGRPLKAAADAGFDLLLRVDKNIRHQQNLTTRPFAVVVIMWTSSRLKHLVPFIPAVEAALSTLVPRTLGEVS